MPCRHVEYQFPVEPERETMVAATADECHQACVGRNGSYFFIDDAIDDTRCECFGTYMGLKYFENTRPRNYSLRICDVKGKQSIFHGIILNQIIL